MKPALFEYSRPEGLLEAISLKQTLGESAVFLAGGQSLVPAMNLRESTPSHVIDINRVQELHEFDLNDEWATLGSLCRFSDLLENDDLRQRLPSLLKSL